MRLLLLVVEQVAREPAVVVALEEFNRARLLQ
jgi:hypothetical protein